MSEEEIEQVGYKEFYRYYIEAHKLAKQYSKELQQKENIIKEVREYIEKHKNNLLNTFDEDIIFGDAVKPILEILDKGESK